MRTAIICSNLRLRSRWGFSLAGGERAAEVVKTVRELPAGDRCREPIVVLVHRKDLPEDGAGLARIIESCPSARILVLADLPSEAEGLLMLREGAMGYCNAKISPPQLSQAVDALRQGQVWVGSTLMTALIRNLGRREAPAPAFPERPLKDVAGITERESEVAGLVALGHSNLEIAALLGISERTVKSHLSAIFEKTGTTNRLNLALRVRSSKPGGSQ